MRSRETKSIFEIFWEKCCPGTGAPPEDGEQGAGQQEPEGAADASTDASEPPEGLKFFTRRGGAVLRVPENSGHMSLVYESARPRLAKIIFDRFSPLESPWLERLRWSWEGAALSYSVEPRTPHIGPLRTDAATDRARKSVNQDAVACCEGLIDGDGEPVAVVAIADGVSEAPYSEFGSVLAVTAAVEGAVACLLESADLESPPLAFRDRIHESLDSCSLAMAKVSGETRTTLRRCEEIEDLSKEGLARARDQIVLFNQSAQELATTLVVACATTRWIVVIGIGNGYVGRIWPGGKSTELWNPDATEPLSRFISANSSQRACSFYCEIDHNVRRPCRLEIGSDGIYGRKWLEKLDPHLRLSSRDLIDRLAREAEDNVSHASITIGNWEEPGES